jgi:glycosyltransferase involved in cell wall biosynthesis
MQEISVIIPTYNRAKYLGYAIESVLAQTLPAAEIIVVDDGSTDETRAVLDALIAGGRIQYHLQPQKGVSSARNKGIELAKYSLIAFLDSDDLFLPTKLEKQYELIAENNDFGFVHCCFSKFNDQGRNLGIRDTSRLTGHIYPEILQEWSILMAMPCMLARKDVLKEVGGFDETMTWAEDMDLWRRISRRYPVGMVPELLVKVRVHGSSTTFERGGGISGFKRYLDKAFEEDKQLGGMFRRKAYAKMYANMGQNLLGEGDSSQMKHVREYEITALLHWPLEISAVFSWLASLLPKRIRNSLIILLRKLRYPLTQTEKL